MSGISANRASVSVVMATPEWKNAAADVPNYATGGAGVLTSKIQ